MTLMSAFCHGNCYKLTVHRYLRNRPGAVGSRHVESVCLKCGHPDTVVVPGRTGKEALAWVKAQEGKA